VREMEACWRSSVGLRGLALNRPVLRWLMTVVVSDREKAWCLLRQVGTRKAFQKRSTVVVGWVSLLRRRDLFQLASESGVL